VTLYNRYILVMALLFGVTSVAFAIAVVSSISLCLTIYIIESLILTELFIYINPKAKRNLNRVNLMLFCLFLAILLDRVLEILVGAGFLSFIR
jgi:hypothetical protein